jgi:hypothetical protein
MKNLIHSTSDKIFIGLIISLALFSALSVFLPQGNLPETVQNQKLPVSKPVLALVNAGVILVVYGGLGYLGLFLSRKLQFTDIYSKSISDKQRFLVPGLIGVLMGIVFIVTDYIISDFHDLGKLPHPPFPTSVVASLSAGIGEELIFRLFFISFWVWLISRVILKKKFKNTVFLIVTAFSAIAFIASHIPSVMMIYGWEKFSEIPIPILLELIILNGSLSLLTAIYFRKFGILAAVSIHFWTDIVWHVIYGLL